MKVELLRYTDDPEMLASIASHICVSDKPELVRSDGFRHAVKAGHESVLEHASFTFLVSGVSRALTHQLVRHRVASYSQKSQRYVNMADFEYVTPDSIKNDPKLKEVYDAWMGQIAKFYEMMTTLQGVPEEDARYILPNACCTSIIVTMNARELRHFFALRCCTRAQWEIRELANRMLALCKDVAPLMFEDAGPSCVQTGRCPEGSKSCGKVKQ